MNIFADLFAVLCALIIPLAAIVICLFFKQCRKPVLLGALCFTVFQLILRLPIIQLVLPYQSWYLTLSTAEPILYSLFLGVTAGMFEEFGRFIIIKLFMKKDVSSPLSGIFFGIGHGGIEAILLVGINALLILMTAPKSVAPAQMLAAGAERISTLILHIGWSVMVVQAVREKKFFLVLIAFASHSIIDTGAMLASFFGIGTLAIEIAIALCAAVMLLYIVLTIRSYRKVKYTT